MDLAAINVKKPRGAQISTNKKNHAKKQQMETEQNHSTDRERLPDAPLGRGAQRDLLRCASRG